MVDKTKLSPRQKEALIAARDKGGAIYVRGSRAGGAIRRMCENLAARGLVQLRPPFAITDAGRAALADDRPDRQRTGGHMTYV